jgi:nucleoside-diphosphate-sugar epimerase
MANVLIAGCGYVGEALGEQLIAQNHRVWGLRRTLPFDTRGISYFSADLTKLDTLSPFPASFDYVVYACAAKNSSEEAYRDAYVTGLWNLLTALEQEQQQIKRLVYVSSTGVYHQNDGEWVDETSPARTDRPTGKILLEAEQVLAMSVVPSTVVRFSGIYGPGRTRMIDMVASGEARLHEGASRVLNHIHVEDCAGILRHILRLDAPADLYLGTDSEPVDRNEALRWIADQLRVPAPPTEPAENAPTSRGGNRRYSNKRILESGYKFRYPTYREGYSSLM